MIDPVLLGNILGLHEPDAAIACLANGNAPGDAPIVGANNAACGMLGLCREEILALTPGRLLTNFEGLTGNDAPTETADTRVEHTLSVNGRDVPVEVRCRTLSLNGDTLSVIILRDISRRRHRELCSARDEQRFKTLYNLSRMIDHTENEILDYALEQAVYMTESRMGYIGFVNEAETELTMHSWSAAAVRECAIEDPPCSCRIQDAGLWAEAMRRRKPMITNDYEACPHRRGLPAGHVRIHRHMNLPVMDGGRIRLLVGVADKEEDYTESDVVQLTLIMEGVWRIVQRKRMEIDLLRAMREAERANRAKGQFLANMSHELRTPLNGIMGMTQLLMGTGGLSEEQKEYLALSLESSSQLSRVMSSLLDISAIESGGATLNRTDFDLPEAIRAVAEPLAAQAEAKGLDFSCRLDDSLPVMVNGDVEKFRQILVNLIHNAVKFTEAGKITLTAARTPGTGEDRTAVRVTVADTGVAIPEDKRETIFESFTLGEEYLTKRYGGVGLGLSISRQLAVLMGGELALESEPGQGNVFSFTVPLRERRDTGGEPARPRPNEAGQRLSILVAEDEGVNALMTSRILRNHGHMPTVVGNGQHAIEALMRDDYDLVLMDVQMPVVNGVEVTEIIRSGAAEGIDREIPIIGLTAYAAEEDRERFVSAGMDIVVTKPFDAEALVDAITGVLRERAPI
ncbi:MAG: GAF domain-containing protein [Pseudodesulfovibrio sp.]|uniref:hybrid sensor histidine kinase/response regulator n=1 Tax=Pseudodesulfovibrio sp. TaxID=2035812 RepID=UPI003D0B032A